MTTIEVLFFAGLREQLGLSSTSVDLNDLSTASPTVGAVRSYLLAQHDPDWQALNDDDVIAALNQQVVSADAPVKASDELAFFPPVTGG